MSSSQIHDEKDAAAATYLFFFCQYTISYNLGLCSYFLYRLSFRWVLLCHFLLWLREKKSTSLKFWKFVMVVVVVHRHFISLPWNEAIKKYWAADNSNASHLALLKVENFDCCVCQAAAKWSRNFSIEIVQEYAKRNSTTTTTTARSFLLFRI